MTQAEAVLAKLVTIYWTAWHFSSKHSDLYSQKSGSSEQTV